MRWTVLIINVLAAVGFVILAAFLHGAHRTHAYSTYRELEIHHAIVEKPSYTNEEPLDVEARLRAIGGGGRYYSLLSCSRHSHQRSP
jgi:hypothetical protein